MSVTPVGIVRSPLPCSPVNNADVSEPKLIAPDPLVSNVLSWSRGGIAEHERFRSDLADDGRDAAERPRLVERHRAARAARVDRRQSAIAGHGADHRYGIPIAVDRRAGRRVIGRVDCLRNRQVVERLQQPRAAEVERPAAKNGVVGRGNRAIDLRPAAEGVAGVGERNVAVDFDAVRAAQESRYGQRIRPAAEEVAVRAGRKRAAERDAARGRAVASQSYPVRSTPDSVAAMRRRPFDEGSIKPLPSHVAAVEYPPEADNAPPQEINTVPLPSAGLRRPSIPNQFRIGR